MVEHEAVLVTGGAGYIGSHACKALHEKGQVPVAYDSLVNGHADFVKWGPLVTGDIGDEALVRATVKEYSIRSVMHFAAFAEVEQSVRDPELYYDNNLAKSVRFIRAVRQAGVRYVVFSSSCAVYGIPDISPIHERVAVRPVNPYGESKLATERMLEAYDRAYQLRSLSLRYFNAAGADLNGEIGERHNPETHLIPLVLEAAAGRRSEVLIYGGDYPTRDGTALRDYIHVQDIVDAHLRGLEYLRRGGSSRMINLGTGQGYSVREIISAVERLIGCALTSRIVPRRAGDPPELIADIALAAKVLNWIPKYSDLDTIVSSAWSWHRNAAKAFDQPDRQVSKMQGP